MTNERKIGHHNTGYYNTGDWNTGNRNTGNYNAGYRNTGHCNTGHHNTGYWNTGNHNTGNHNTSDCNTGDYNTGYYNTGDWNTGDYNSGYRNTGDYNTGNHNTGDHNTGYCNTITPEDCLIFNKPAKRKDWKEAIKPSWMQISITEWVSEFDMSNKEKEAYPSYTTTGGYLKVFTNPHHAYIEAWAKATPEDKANTLKLPNFDPNVFKEIFGFDATADTSHTITIDGKEIKLSEKSYNELKKHFNERGDDE